MKYNKTDTQNHIVSLAHESCLKDFNQIVLDEDDSISVLPTYFINDEIVLDLDCVEVNLAKSSGRNRNRTMDTAFVISNTSKMEVLLVELRFNYQNLSNLNRIVLLEKVQGSILALGTSIAINGNYIFIFQPHLIQQAISRLQRMNPRIPNNYVAMDLARLIGNYF